MYRNPKTIVFSHVQCKDKLEVQLNNWYSSIDWRFFAWVTIPIFIATIDN